MRATFVQWIAYWCQDSRAKGALMWTYTLPLSSQFGPLVNAGSSPRSQTPDAVAMGRPFESQQLESERLYTWQNLPETGPIPLHCTWFSRGLANACQNQWMNEKNTWRRKWIDVWTKKSEWMHEWVSESGNEVTHGAPEGTLDVQEAWLQDQPLGSCLGAFKSTSFFHCKHDLPFGKTFKA